jgi:Family of unknown function (DUF5996)
MTQPLPPLPYDAWDRTLRTLHLYVQIVGKVKLVTTRPRNHWWNIALHVDVRGLTTGLLELDGRSFDLGFDFVDHRVVLRTDAGATTSFRLADGLSVADFDAKLHELLRAEGLDVTIRELPYGMPVTTPFPTDEEDASYDREHVERFWQILAWSHGVLDEFSGWFCGKQSPVHLFWHGLDLAYTRFSGRRAALDEGVDAVTREAYSHEVISFGFWAGQEDVPEASFYSYTAPEPPGLREHVLAPVEARWLERPNGSLAVLSYDVVRRAGDPRMQLLAFLQSAYEAGVAAAGWDAEELASSACPPPSELQRLRLSVA